MLENRMKHWARPQPAAQAPVRCCKVMMASCRVPGGAARCNVHGGASQGVGQAKSGTSERIAAMSLRRGEEKGATQGEGISGAARGGAGRCVKGVKGLACAQAALHKAAARRQQAARAPGRQGWVRRVLWREKQEIRGRGWCSELTGVPKMGGRVRARRAAAGWSAGGHSSRLPPKGG